MKAAIHARVSADSQQQRGTIGLDNMHDAAGAGLIERAGACHRAGRPRSTSTR